MVHTDTHISAPEITGSDDDSDFNALVTDLFDPGDDLFESFGFVTVAALPFESLAAEFKHDPFVTEIAFHKLTSDIFTKYNP
jgi:hypothetical protein